MLISDISCRTLIYKDMNSAQRAIEGAEKAGYIVKVEFVKVESLDLECVKVKIIYRVGDYAKKKIKENTI